jgi:hypothetical protein
VRVTVLLRHPGEADGLAESLALCRLAGEPFRIPGLRLRGVGDVDAVRPDPRLGPGSYVVEGR